MMNGHEWKGKKIHILINQEHIQSVICEDKDSTINSKTYTISKCEKLIIIHIETQKIRFYKYVKE